MKELLQRNNFPARQVDVLAPFLVEDDSSQSIPIRTHNTILFVGRIVPEKGLTYLMRALSSVRKEWRLLVAGDGEERSHCESLAEELGVSGQIRFLGWVDEHELARLYDDSSFVVVPSLWPEPFGRVGPEAATRGRAAVAFDTGGVSDWLVDSVSGYLVPPGDLGLLSERVNSLLDSHAQQVEMGQQARVLAFAKWNSIDHVNHLITHLSAAHIKDTRHLVGGY